MKDQDWLQINLRRMRVACSVAAWENFGTPPWLTHADQARELDGVLEQISTMLVYHNRQRNMPIDRPSMAEMCRARLGLAAHPVEFSFDKVNGRVVEDFLNNNYIAAFDIAGVGHVLEVMTHNLAMAVPQRQQSIQ